MPFIDPHKLLFVHIPKTGGTSVEMKFKVCTVKHELYSTDIIPQDGILMAKQHWLPKIIEKNFPEKFKEYKKFTIIRNPYIKTISSYFYTFPSGRVTFEDFIFNRLNPFEKDHWLPQYKYFENIKYDYVLRTETLNADFAKMSKDFKFDGKLTRANKRNNGSENKLNMLTPKIIKRINSLYERDFIDFDYKMR